VKRTSGLMIHTLKSDNNIFRSWTVEKGKAWVCGRSLAGIVGPNPASGTLLSVVCYQVEVSASSWSLIQRSPTDCGVSECHREASTMRRPWPTGGWRAMKERQKENKGPPFLPKIAYNGRYLHIQCVLCNSSKSLAVLHRSSSHHQSCHTGGLKPFRMPYEARYSSRHFGKVFSRMSRPTLGPTEVFSPGVKRPGHEVDHSPPKRDEVMNEWKCISIPPPPKCLQGLEWNNSNIWFLS
jgi:hypothetical protein